VVYHARKWHVHVASAFPLARYYCILFARACHPVARLNGFTNCGEEVCPKNAKTGLIDASLADSTGKSCDFWSFRNAVEVSQAKIRSQHAVWMQGAEVDASFRIGIVFGRAADHWLGRRRRFQVISGDREIARLPECRPSDHFFTIILIVVELLPPGPYTVSFAL
jgi:hypothetical protein